ncbi:MAG TPA: hypothetical protein VL866_01305 [Pyrinomonadaceae bacterium]|nr:hypothetical protein [Pyrinomonadaceae bacterium]
MKLNCRFSPLALLLLAIIGICSLPTTYSQSPRNIEERVNALLARMTLEEKLGRDLRFVVEPGEFKIMVGANSEDVTERSLILNSDVSRQDAKTQIRTA